jgi:hypothetical protein
MLRNLIKPSSEQATELSKVGMVEHLEMSFSNTARATGQGDKSRTGNLPSSGRVLGVGQPRINYRQNLLVLYWTGNGIRSAEGRGISLMASMKVRILPVQMFICISDAAGVVKVLKKDTCQWYGESGQINSCEFSCALSGTPKADLWPAQGDVTPNGIGLDP